MSRQAAIQEVLQVVVGGNPPGLQEFVLPHNVSQRPEFWGSNVDPFQLPGLVFSCQSGCVIVVGFLPDGAFLGRNHGHGTDAQFTKKIDHPFVRAADFEHEIVILVFSCQSRQSWPRARNSSGSGQVFFPMPDHVGATRLMRVNRNDWIHIFTCRTTGEASQCVSVDRPKDTLRLQHRDSVQGRRTYHLLGVGGRLHKQAGGIQCGGVQQAYIIGMSEDFGRTRKRRG